MTAVNARTGFPTPIVIASGVVLGLLYTLSPLSVLMLPLLVWGIWWAARDLPVDERRWFLTMVALAVAIRLAAIAALFLFAGPQRPYAVFFGDEDLFKSRSVWVRNIGLDVPISTPDYIYAVEETGKSNYLLVIAYLEALIGDAPYGMHVLNMVMSMLGIVALFRMMRRSYGPFVGFSGLAILLFLPSLFFWSISALKEPLFTFMAVAELACALAIVRAPKWPLRVLAAVGVIGLGVLLEGLRRGGFAVALLGTLGGVAAGLVIPRPRMRTAAIIGVPVLVAVLLTLAPVQNRVMALVRQTASYHMGHVQTIGYSYKTLDEWYYISPADIQRMSGGDAVKFVVRSAVAYVTQPLPWAVQTRASLAYLPLHMIWLALLALVPLGIGTGWRRDSLMTAVVAAHALAVMMLVALPSGNVGTLIRHRDLALLYTVWLSALGASRLVALVSAPSTRVSGDLQRAHG